MFKNRGLPHLSDSSYSGRMSKQLPPRSPLLSMNHMSTDRGSSPPMGKRHTPVPKENQRQHQRTSSESFIVEEQPAWLDDLLNEPETPAGRGNHRRSSSDSVAYLDFPGTYTEIQRNAQHELCSGEIASFPLAVSLDFDLRRNAPQASFYLESNSTGRHVQGWDSSVNSYSYQTHVTSRGDSSMLANLRPPCIHQGRECLTAEKTQTEKSGDYDHRECSERRDSLFVKSALSDMDQHDQKGSFKNHCSNGKSTASDTDPKRAKQHFAQRSRVRKLQYIAELERNVSILNAEGSDAAAELAFLKQQHLILSLENKALTQRITTIAHEKQIKDAEYDLLRKEVERLQEVYCNQQQERSKFQCSNEVLYAAADHLDVRFGCLSLTSTTHMETGSMKKPKGISKAPYPCMMLQKS